MATARTASGAEWWMQSQLALATALPGLDLPRHPLVSALGDARSAPGISSDSSDSIAKIQLHAGAGIKRLSSARAPGTAGDLNLADLPAYLGHGHMGSVSSGPAGRRLGAAVFRSRFAVASRRARIAA